MRQLEGFLRRRREAVEFEEGVAMLREIEKREKELFGIVRMFFVLNC